MSLKNTKHRVNVHRASVLAGKTTSSKGYGRSTAQQGELVHFFSGKVFEKARIKSSRGASSVLNGQKSGFLPVALERISRTSRIFAEREGVKVPAVPCSMVELTVAYYLAPSKRTPEQMLITLYVWVKLLTYCLLCCSLVATYPTVSHSHFNCIEKPTIAHANLLPDSDSYLIKYVCNQGFRMVNPLTIEPSIGILNCTINSGWLPQPLPECWPIELTYSKPNNEESRKHACKCPHEDFKGVRVSEVVHGTTRPHDHYIHPSRDGYSIGDMLIFTCNVSRDDKLAYDSKPENFFVYPSAYRTCQTDCTWSGFPPVCLDPLKPMNYTKVLLRKVTHCLAGDCLQNKKWIPIGDFKKRQETNYTHMYLIEFPRHVHLNFVTFKSVNGNGATMLGNADVQLKVNSWAEVINLSSESRSLVDSRYNKLQLGSRSAIKARAFIREVIFKFYVDTASNWSPQLEFYAVPEYGLTGLEGGKCPNPPLIPNAHVQISKDGLNVEYRCNKGYQLKEPLLNERFREKIRCHHGFEWTPYPFPVCQAGDSSSLAGSIEEEEDLSNSTISHTMFPTNPHFSDNNNDPESHSTISSKVAHVEFFVMLGESDFIFAACLALLGCFGTVLIVLISFSSYKLYLRLKDYHDYDRPADLQAHECKMSGWAVNFFGKIRWCTCGQHKPSHQQTRGLPDSAS